MITAFLIDSGRDNLMDSGHEDEGYPFNVFRRHDGTQDGFGVYVSRDEGRCQYDDEETRLTVALSGRILNKEQLAGELSEDHREDARLIYRGYLKYGEKIFDLLEGCFSVIIWDRNRHHLLAYRDHMGAIPLFFSRFKDGIIVSTEIGTSWPRNISPHDLNAQGVFNYLHEKSFLSPSTPYKSVKSLNAGELLKYDSGKITLEKRYRLRFNQSFMDEQEALKELENSLLKVMEEMIAPFSEIGVLLSGGSDSLFLISILKSLTDKPLRTYTILMGNNSVDEAYANKAASYFGAKHKNVFLTDELIRKHAEQIICDYPMPTIGGWHVYFGTHAAKEDGVPATMAGFGGEVAFGIPFSKVLNRIHQYYKPLDALPAPLNRFFMYSLKYLGDRLNGISYYADELCRYLRFRQGIHLWHAGKLEEDDILTLMAEQGEAYDSIRLKYLEDYLQSNTDNFIEQLTYARLLHFVGNAVLGKLNTLAEKKSVELLMPFLDRRMLETSFKIPFQIKAGRFRHLEEKIASKYHHFKREKAAFVMPFDRWLKTTLRELAERAFNPDNIERQGLFDPLKLSRIWSDYLSGDGTPTWSDIFQFVTLSVWLDEKDVLF